MNVNFARGLRLLSRYGIDTMGVNAIPSVKQNAADTMPGPLLHGPFSGHGPDFHFRRWRRNSELTLSRDAGSGQMATHGGSAE